MATFKQLFVHYLDTAAHKGQVIRFTLKTCCALIKRSLYHDMSKFSKWEAPIFAEVSAKLKDLDYGSDEYFKSIQELEEALDHHYARNPHHPEHYLDGGFQDMRILDIVEMLIDWKAATLRHENGDIMSSVDHNKGRFGYSDKWAEKFKQFFKEIKAD